MSLVLNMVGGGGGSLKDTDAILTVTVPTGSTVTATKGGTTLTPTMWVQAAEPTLDCALFVISPSLFDSVNPWTVTAALGTDTASDTVTIDSNEQYDLVLSYHVPAGYTEVEYIEGTGTQWINCNVAPAVTFGAKIRCAATTSEENDVFGMYQTSGGGTISRVDIYQAKRTYTNGVWSLFIGAGQGTNEDTIGVVLGEMVDIEYQQEANIQTFNVNGTTKTISLSAQALQMCSLFRYYGKSVSIGKMRIKSAELTNNGVLARKMYACYRNSDGVAGMWDNVSETFFTNAGSGAFIVGPDA